MLLNCCHEHATEQTVMSMLLKTLSWICYWTAVVSMLLHSCHEYATELLPWVCYWTAVMSMLMNKLSWVCYWTRCLENATELLSWVCHWTAVMIMLVNMLSRVCYGARCHLYFTEHAFLLTLTTPTYKHTQKHTHHSSYNKRLHQLTNHPACKHADRHTER